MKIINGRPRNMGLEEIRHQPDGHTFDLASLNGLFDLIEIIVLGVNNDAVGRLLVYQLHQLLDGAIIQVHLANNLVPFPNCPPNLLPQPGCFTLRAHQDQASAQLGLPKLTLQPPTNQLLFNYNQTKTHKPKQDDDRTGQRLLRPKEKDDNDQCDRRDETGLQESPNRLPAGGKQGSLVKSVHPQEQRHKRDDDEVKPGIIVKWRNLGRAAKNLNFPVGPPKMRQPQPEGKQGRIEKLLDLCSD